VENSSQEVLIVAMHSFTTHKTVFVRVPGTLGNHGRVLTLHDGLYRDHPDFDWVFGCFSGEHLAGDA